MTGPAQPIEWYLARDNKQYGPLSDLELMKLVELRHLKDEDLLWRAGFSDWKPAQEVFPEAFTPAEPANEPEVPPSGPADESAPEQLGAPEEPETEAPRAAPAAASEQAAYTQSVASHADAQTVTSGPVATGHEPQASAAARTEPASDYRTDFAPGFDSAPVAIQPGAMQAPAADPRSSRLDIGAGRHAPEPEQRAARQRWSGNDGAPAAKLNGHHHQATPRGEPRLDLSLDPYRGQSRNAADPYAARSDAVPSAAGLSASLQAPVAPGPVAAPLEARGARVAPVPRAAPARAPVVAQHEFDDEEAEAPPRKRRVGGLIAVLVLLAAMVGGVWFYFINPTVLTMSVGSIVSGSGDSTPAPPKDGAAVLASASAKEMVMAAAKPLAASPLQNFPESTAGIDQMLQMGYLWQVVRAEFPEWYDERLRETARMVTEKRPDDAITKHLIDSLIQLRRKNADHAFAASLPKLQQVARRFRDSLDTLTKHSQVACFSLISNGEGTRGMVGLIRDPAYGPTLQAGLAAIFEAIADGRRSPQSKLAPRRSDYDLLTKELKALGWSEDDLGKFADPDELAKLPQERVCGMVREWFTAHLAVPDKEIQRRLLVESVRPVVAG